jgi:hypothetical protein
MQLGSDSSYRQHRLAWEVEEAEEVVVEAYRRLCVCVLSRAFGNAIGPS